MAYLIDADVLIRAKNQHYDMAFCPAFWDWLSHSHASGRVFSVEKVGDELGAQDDELSDWAEARGSDFFLRPTGPSLAAMNRVSNWVNDQRYAVSAVNIFLQKADYYLVAQALAGSHTVVTHEVPSGSINKVKIPDVCIGLGIKCMLPFEMLRNERARFVLSLEGRAVARPR